MPVLAGTWYTSRRSGRAPGYKVHVTWTTGAQQYVSQGWPTAAWLLLLESGSTCVMSLRILRDMICQAQRAARLPPPGLLPCTAFTRLKLHQRQCPISHILHKAGIAGATGRRRAMLRAHLCEPVADGEGARLFAAEHRCIPLIMPAVPPSRGAVLCPCLCRSQS